MDTNTTLYTNDIPQRNKKNHIPMCDVDDLAFRNRHDPKFVADITNLMQVPSTITVTNGHKEETNNTKGYIPVETFAMDIPEKLTAENILQDRISDVFLKLTENDKYIDNNNDNNNYNSLNSNEPTTPSNNNNNNNNTSFNFNEDKLSKTPQISEDLYKRMRPRRSSLESDLNTEIRLLRDKINRLEHECQINTQTNRVFYVILSGYVLFKTFSWLLNR